MMAHAVLVAISKNGVVHESYLKSHNGSGRALSPGTALESRGVPR